MYEDQEPEATAPISDDEAPVLIASKTFRTEDEAVRFFVDVTGEIPSDGDIAGPCPQGTFTAWLSGLDAELWALSMEQTMTKRDAPDE